MPMTEEAKSVAYATLMPGACYVVSGLSYMADNGETWNWFKNLKRPSWAIPSENAMFYHSLADALTIPPAAYATHLVYKSGGGFKFDDTKLALASYASFFALGTAIGFPALKNRSLKGLTFTSAVMFANSLVMYHLYYNIEKKAGYLTLPLCGALAFYTMMIYKMWILNDEKTE